jgi:UDP-N-acetylmuramyl pentapeptide synthase
VGGVVEELAWPGDRVLIKGSRSAGLERVVGAE